MLNSNTRHIRGTQREKLYIGHKKRFLGQNDHFYAILRCVFNSYHKCICSDVVAELFTIRKFQGTDLLPTKISGEMEDYPKIAGELPSVPKNIGNSLLFPQTENRAFRKFGSNENRRLPPLTPKTLAVRHYHPNLSAEKKIKTKMSALCFRCLFCLFYLLVSILGPRDTTDGNR